MNGRFDVVVMKANISQNLRQKQETHSNSEINFCNFHLGELKFTCGKRTYK